MGTRVIDYGNYKYIKEGYTFDSYHDFSKFVPKQNYDIAKETAYDEKHFNDLINSNRYLEASEYLSQFHFKDPEKEKENENDIYNLRMQGLHYNAIYDKAKELYGENNKEVIDKIDFVNGLNNKNAFGNIDASVRNKNSENYNAYIDQYLSFKEDIGGKDATMLSITFQNPKRSFIFDAWAADTPEYSFDTFIDNLGMNQEQLKSNNVNITPNSDGSTTITFAKCNDIANAIFLSMPDNMVSTTYAPDFGDKDYRNTGAPILSSFDNKGNQITSYNLTGLIGIQNFKNLYNNANEVNNAVLKTLNNGTDNMVYYSSTVGASLIDGMDELTAAYQQGLVNDAYYKREMTRLDNFINESIKVLGTSNYEFYSNAYNNKEDDTLVKLSPLEKLKMKQIISGTDSKNIHLNAMISNGQIGTLVTIDAVKKAEKDIGVDDLPEDQIKTKQYQIFIPGLFTDKAQEKINSDTDTRSMQELDNVRNWGYKYKVNNDKKEIINDRGMSVMTPKELYFNAQIDSFVYDDNPISKEEASFIINKDMMIEDTARQLKYKHLNKNGKIFDTDAYAKDAKMMAISIAENLMPQVSMTKKDGKRINPYNMTIEDIDYIFGLKGAGDVVCNKYSDNMNYELYKKYNIIYSAYSSIMSNVSMYNR